MKSAGKARSNGLYRHIRTSKEIIRNLLNDLSKYNPRYKNRPDLLLRKPGRFDCVICAFPSAHAITCGGS